MDEVRKNQIVQMETKGKTKFEGIVFSYTKDRIAVLVSYDSLQEAKKINELDKLLVKINTHLGVKQMFSHVIDPLARNNCVVIENNEALPIVQKREFVRVLSSFTFKIEKEDESVFECYCLNISGGGIAFSSPNCAFELGEKVLITLPEQEFEKEIEISGSIIKIYDSHYVIKYDNNIASGDEGKIIKHVFKLIAQK